MRDRPVFDVSLMAGHRDYLGSRSDFTSQFIRRLAAAGRQAKRLAPSLLLIPAGRLHFTLRAVYGDRSPDFQKHLSAAEFQRRYAEVTAWFRELGKRDVLWVG